MEDQWRIAKHDPEWKHQFLEVASRLRYSLANRALRIDHIGSTSVLGLDAKPVIDIQISVESLGDLSDNQERMESAGFVYREDNEDKSKRYFRESPGSRRTHIHVRQAGSFSEQMNLLFRDYLRVHPEACFRYGQEKHRLMAIYKHDRSKYVEGKGPIVWEIIQLAHQWSQVVGWRPGESDV